MKTQSHGPQWGNELLSSEDFPWSDGETEPRAYHGSLGELKYRQSSPTRNQSFDIEQDIELYNSRSTSRRGDLHLPALSITSQLIKDRSADEESLDSMAALVAPQNTSRLNYYCTTHEGKISVTTPIAASDERGAASDERNVAFDERNAASDERNVAFDERNAASDERNAAFDERNAASDEINAASDERGVASDERGAAPPPNAPSLSSSSSPPSRSLESDDALTLKSTSSFSALGDSTPVSPGGDEEFFDRSQISRRIGESLYKNNSLLDTEDLGDGNGSPEPIVPEEYENIATTLDLPSKHLTPLFTEEGLVIPKCFSAIRYRNDVIEEFKCKLVASRTYPILCLTMLDRPKRTRRLLLPDLMVTPTTVPSALDAFVDYKWPRGDGQLLELKHSPMIMANFRNSREPFVFTCASDEDQRGCNDALLVIFHLARKRETEKKLIVGDILKIPQVLPLPHVMIAKGHKYVPSVEEFQAERTKYRKNLSLVGNRLDSLHAIKAQLKSEMKNDIDFVVTRWCRNKSKIKQEHLKVWIHHTSPYLMVTDKRGKPIEGLLNLNSFHSIREKLKLTPNLPKNMQSMPHITAVDLYDDSEHQMYFSFPTVESLKDFNQVVATLGYLQDVEFLSGSPYSQSKFLLRNDELTKTKI